MAETREEARARRLEEMRQAREEKAAQMAADRLNTRAAAVEPAAATYYAVSPVKVGATTAERVEALKDIRAAENLATYSAAPEFKAISFNQLDPQTRGVINANAAANGMSPEEYYKARGGVNQSGYYGDSYTAGLTLSEREYQIARLEGGIGTTGAGSAINLASAKKAYDYYIAQGDNPVKASIKSGYTGVSIQVKANAAPGGGNLYLHNGKYYDESGTEVDQNAGKSAWSAAPVNVTTVSTAQPLIVTSSTTQPIVSTTSVTTQPTTMTTAQQDVYSIMLGRLNQYNLGSLAPLIRDLAIKGATESTIMLQLSEEPLYKERFKANETRKQKGLSVLTPSQYLSLEDDYRQVLRAYGLTQFDNDAYVSQFLANDVSVSELSNRVVTAVQRVRNADPAVSNMLKNLYGIGQNDLVAYVLDPQQQFQKIERQVAASEISVAAARQGFNIGATVAEQLAAQGISQAEAQKGYATIADILPTAEKLSDIYGGQLESYRLAEGEQEVFNQLASAQRKRRALTERELASFSGQAGLGRTSLTQQVGGQF
jgi:hypothetical protein